MMAWLTNSDTSAWTSLLVGLFLSALQLRRELLDLHLQQLARHASLALFNTNWRRLAMNLLSGAIDADCRSYARFGCEAYLAM
jgi:hypothetical protein